MLTPAVASTIAVRPMVGASAGVVCLPSVSRTEVMRQPEGYPLAGRHAAAIVSTTSCLELCIKLHWRARHACVRNQYRTGGQDHRELCAQVVAEACRRNAKKEKRVRNREAARRFSKRVRASRCHPNLNRACLGRGSQSVAPF